MAKKVNVNVKKDEKKWKDPEWRKNKKQKTKQNKLTVGIQRKIPQLYRDGDSDWLILLIDTAHPKNTTKYPIETKGLGITTDYVLHYNNDGKVLR